MQHKMSEGTHSLSYANTGTGDTIVLIHGFGEDNRIWNHQVAFLQNNYHLLIPNLPGTGQSAIGNSELSVESMATGIKQMLDEEKIGQCIMLGHSMGGKAAMQLALTQGHLLRRLGRRWSSGSRWSARAATWRRSAVRSCARARSR